MLGWHHIPGSRTSFRSQEFDVELQFSSRGLRGVEKPYTLSPDTFRILILGDSFVEGHGVDLEDSLPVILEQNLDGTIPGIKFDVVAHGVSGFSTDQELLWLESEGLKYRPDLIFLMIYYDDVMPNIATKSWGIPKPLFDLKGKQLALYNVPVPRTPQTDKRSTVARIRNRMYAVSNLFLLLNRALLSSPLKGFAVRTGIVVPPIQKETDPWYEQRVFRLGDRGEVEKAWRLMSALLNRMDDRAEKSGAELVLFHIPIRERIHASTHRIEREYMLSMEEWESRVYENRIQRVGRQLGIHLINPEEDFLSRAQMGRKLYFDRDLHWNEEGHRAAAQAVNDFIRVWFAGSDADRRRNSLPQ